MMINDNELIHHFKKWYRKNKRDDNPYDMTGLFIGAIQAGKDRSKRPTAKVRGRKISSLKGVISSIPPHSKSELYNYLAARIMGDVKALTGKFYATNLISPIVQRLFEELSELDPSDLGENPSHNVKSDPAMITLGQLRIYYPMFTGREADQDEGNFIELCEVALLSFECSKPSLLVERVLRMDSQELFKFSLIEK